ncbi:MAG: fibrillarin-like rRNA/tRNA 2'-O-methyltransferase [archaeon]
MGNFQKGKPIAGRRHFDGERSGPPGKLPPRTILVGRDIATENLVPGQTVYDEDLVKRDGLEYRKWNPKKSKLCAAILKGMDIHISEDFLTLYLGVSSGTTASHVSDICRTGMIFGIDPAQRVMRDFYMLSKKRANLAPIFGGAEFPEKYSSIVPKVDFVYQDVAQRAQAEIFLKNCKAFLKKNGRGLLMVKARSIDVRKVPAHVFSEVKKKLEAGGMKILQERRLEPFERDHIAFYCGFVSK